MIVGIGTDIIEVRRVIEACSRKRFYERVFTEKERILIEEKKVRCAGNFAVKEAVVKVLGTGFLKISPDEIEVLRDELGKPYVTLYGKARKQQEKLGIQRIFVTISDTKEYAVAYAVGEAVTI